MGCARREARGARRVRGWVAFVLLTSARGAAAGNSIGDAGASAVAVALMVNCTVTDIRLQCACPLARARTLALS